MSIDLDQLKNEVPVELYNYFINSSLTTSMDYSHIKSYKIVDLDSIITIFARTRRDFLYVYEFSPGKDTGFDDEYNFTVYAPKDVMAIIKLFGGVDFGK